MPVVTSKKGQDTPDFVVSDAGKGQQVAVGGDGVEAYQLRAVILGYGVFSLKTFQIAEKRAVQFDIF